MSRSTFVAEHLDRAWAGPAWHSDSIAELLADVSASEAGRRPDPRIHTIAELVGHIGAWAVAAAQRLNGEPGSPSEAEQWPVLDTSSDAAWAAAVRRVRDQHVSLMRAAAQLDDSQLDAEIPGRKQSAAILLHGIVEHDAYHGGQIAMLKKLVRG